MTKTKKPTETVVETSEPKPRRKRSVSVYEIVATKVATGEREVICRVNTLMSAKAAFQMAISFGGDNYTSYGAYKTVQVLPEAEGQSDEVDE